MRQDVVDGGGEGMFGHQVIFKERRRQASWPIRVGAAVVRALPDQPISRAEQAEAVSELSELVLALRSWRACSWLASPGDRPSA